MIARRRFPAPGLISLAAPLVVKASSLMPVRPVLWTGPGPRFITLAEWLDHGHRNLAARRVEWRDVWSLHALYLIPA